jgi:hypothetical protein
MPSDMPTKSPTNTPTSAPTASPTTSPTAAPTPSGWAYKFVFNTDETPAETTWTVTDNCDDDNEVLNGSGDSEAYYLEIESRYTLTINDANSDGSGFYEVTHSSRHVVASGDTFRFDISVTFGQCAPTEPPTLSPTLSPTESPTPAPTAFASAAPAWIEIISDDFEAGLGNFNDGGGDAGLSTRNSHNGGSNSAYIRDDSGGRSSVYSEFFPVSSYSKIKVEFWYLSKNFDNGDNFYLETDTGSGGWSNVYTWIYGQQFTSNKQWRSASFIITPVNSSDLRIRFRNNGDGNREQIYIDEVVVSGIQ